MRHSKTYKKYNSFFSKKEQRNIAIANLIENQIRAYKNDMFCPSCHNAKLDFVSKTSTKIGHLRTNRSASHQSGCPYNYVPVENHITKEEMEKISPHKTHDILQSLKRKLFETKLQSKTHSNENMQNNFVSVEEKDTKTGKKTIRQIQCKKLAGSNENDYGKLYAFYGEWNFDYYQDLEKGYRYLWLKDKNGNRYDIKDPHIYHRTITRNALYRFIAIGTLAANLRRSQYKIELSNNALWYEEI